jgi:predicted outer membrane repeat protein
MFGGQAINGARPLGGAVFVWYNARLLASSSYFLQNSATSGGAIYSWGDVLLYASDLRENYLVDANPGTHTQGSAITMHREIFGPARLQILASSLSENGFSDSANHVAQSYALYLRGGAQASLTNTSIIDNSRGIWSMGGSQLGMLSTTIAGNEGFGLRFDHFDNDPPTTQLYILSSVITGNGGVSQCRSATGFFLNPNLAQLQVNDQFNASSDPSCGFNGASDVTLNSWPFHPDIMEADVSRYYQPVPGRGLIDTGGEGCEPQDQRLGDRPINGSGLQTALCDIGAIEFNPEIDPLLPDRIFGDRFEKK